MNAKYQVTEYGSLSSKLLCSKLSDLCVDKIGVQTGPFGSQLHKEDYVDIGTPIITVEHLGNNRISHVDTPFVTDEDKKRLSKYQLKNGDIVFSRVGSVDRRALVRKEEDGWLFSGRCIRIRVDKTKIDPVYLSYFFGLESFKKYIRSIAVGATMPSINTKILSDIPIYYPECLEEQKRIAHIFITNDEKANINNQTNQTLEQMAQAIFKSWFVDFDPVKAKMNGEQPEGMDAATASLFPEKLVESELGLIPDGWRVDSLGNYLDVLETGKRPKGGVKGITEGIPSVGAENILGVGNYQYGKEKFIPEDLFVSLKKGVVESEDVLIYKDGGKPGDFKPRFSMFGYGFPYKTFAINEHVFRIRSSKLGQPYLYCQMRDDYVYNDLRNKGAKAAIPGINQKDVKSMLIVVPNELLLSKFNDSVASIFAMILKNALQSQELAKLRDTLLPKLLSGEIELGKCEDIVN